MATVEARAIHTRLLVRGLLLGLQHQVVKEWTRKVLAASAASEVEPLCQGRGLTSAEVPSVQHTGVQPRQGFCNRCVNRDPLQPSSY